jgi:hypothetical protein
MRGKRNRMGNPTDQPSMMTRYRLIFPGCGYLATYPECHRNYCRRSPRRRNRDLCPQSTARSQDPQIRNHRDDGDEPASDTVRPEAEAQGEKRAERSGAQRSGWAHRQRTENLVRAGERPRWRRFNPSEARSGRVSKRKKKKLTEHTVGQRVTEQRKSG